MLGKPIELAINVLQLRGTQRVLNIVFKHKAKRKWENMSLETKGLSIFLQHLQNLVSVSVTGRDDKQKFQTALWCVELLQGPFFM